MLNFIYDVPKSYLQKLGGIYCLQNVINGKRYVGSSKNIGKRLQKHKGNLCHKNHPNQYSQNSFDKHGAQSFKVSVLARCNSNDLVEKENYWINFYQTTNRLLGYNQALVSEENGNILNVESRAKTSKTLMGGRSIIMLDKKTTKIIQHFNSLYEAASYIIESGHTKACHSYVRMKVSDAARNKDVLTGFGRHAKRLSAYGYKWRIE